MTKTFNGINALAFMAALLVMGVGLRSRFALLQRGLLPAGLIGGALASQRLHACQPDQAVSNACELSFDDIATLDHA
jgi:Na+/glutamate symporter